jgi:EpsI family protein
VTSRNVAWTIAGLMCAAAGLAALARPLERSSILEAPGSLARMVPAEFGEWRELHALQPRIVNPQQQQMLERAYSQLLTRTYADARGSLVMISVAYGNDQRSNEAHFPEVCYPAQGFVVEAARGGELATAFGPIPVRRLFARLGTRREPVTYWFVLGEIAVQGKMERRLADLRYGLSGRVPDGLLFRVSSLDADAERAYRVHDAFVRDLLSHLGSFERLRLAGLGEAPR